ncbi:hypothetical protein GCM10025794_04420 [Massilia kyonggiensis]
MNESVSKSIFLQTEADQSSSSHLIIEVTPLLKKQLDKLSEQRGSRQYLPLCYELGFREVSRLNFGIVLKSRY